MQENYSVCIKKKKENQCEEILSKFKQNFIRDFDYVMHERLL